MIQTKFQQLVCRITNDDCDYGQYHTDVDLTSNVNNDDINNPYDNNIDINSIDKELLVCI